MQKCGCKSADAKEEFSVMSARESENTNHNGENIRQLSYNDALFNITRSAGEEKQAITASACACASQSCSARRHPGAGAHAHSATPHPRGSNPNAV